MGEDSARSRAAVPSRGKTSSLEVGDIVKANLPGIPKDRVFKVREIWVELEDTINPRNCIHCRSDNVEKVTV